MSKTSSKSKLICLEGWLLSMGIKKKNYQPKKPKK